MREKSRWVEKIFTLLMCRGVDPKFRFPKGAIATRTVNAGLAVLDGGTDALSREKVVDFCVCQVYAISQFPNDYIKKWNVSHSFGNKAMERFQASTQGRRYYEDLWLREIAFSREELLDMIRDRSRHPLAKFIYPQYEDHTKLRRTGTEAGMYSCSVSTLMWTPFSPVCSECGCAEKCREMTRKRYPELLRIREEAFEKGGGHDR